MASTPAPRAARIQRERCVSRDGASCQSSRKAATTTALAARATGSLAAQGEMPKIRKLMATIQYPQTG